MLSFSDLAQLPEIDSLSWFALLEVCFAFIRLFFCKLLMHELTALDSHLKNNLKLNCEKDNFG